MRVRSTLLAAACAVLAHAAPTGAQGTPAPADFCGVDRPIVFAGLLWDSALFHNAVTRFILEHGYGCRTDAIPGQTIFLINALALGDVDVIMEIWTANPARPWVEAEAAGQAVSVGTNFPDAVEGWFVPAYLVEGPDAAAPDLVSVTDLARYASLFRDPEEPGRGRFYNCVPGQVCYDINTRKLGIYGLSELFTNFGAGTTAAVNAAVEGAVLARRPVVFYYWAPTWLLGKHDFVMLEEPAFDPAVWAELTTADNPTRAAAYPVSTVIVGANAAFAAAAPQVIAFLDRYETTSALISAALAFMEASDATPQEAAEHFLATSDVWEAWVSPEVAARVRAAL